MKNVIELLLKFGYHLLFVALQFLCFYIIINYNKEQRIIFLNSSSLFSTAINNKVDKFDQYLKLREENDSLQKQNARLIKKFIDYDINSSQPHDDTITIDSNRYHLIAAKICNSTIHLRDNYITLCEGRQQGIKENMGVISQNGLVGIVKKVSDNYSLVMSLLHSQTKISCVIKRNNSLGVLNWKSTDPTIMSLDAVAKHLQVFVGDTVITSGYSAIFPKGVMVGRVKNVELKNGSNSFTIDVKLFNDPSTWDVLYVVNNKQAEEQIKLEATAKNE